MKLSIKNKIHNVNFERKSFFAKAQKQRNEHTPTLAWDTRYGACFEQGERGSQAALIMID